MDKNTLIGLLLIAGLMFGFMLCRNDANTGDESAENQPAKTETAKTEKTVKSPDSLFAVQLAEKINAFGTAAQNGRRAITQGAVDLSVDSLGQNLEGTVIADGYAVDIKNVLDVKSTAISAEVRSAAMAALHTEMDNLDRYREFSEFRGGENKKITLDNGKIRVTFASVGGRIEKVVLPGYKTETTTPPTDIVLFDSRNAGYAFEFETVNQRISTADLNFKASQPNDTTVTMTIALADGAEFGFRYTVVPDDYLVKMDLVQKNISRIIPANRSTMRLTWHQTLNRNEKGRTFEERNSAVYYKFRGESPDDLDANSDDSEQLTGALSWVAFKNQFFSSVLISRKGFETADVSSKVIKNTNQLKTMNMDATFAYSSTSAQPVQFAFFFGPNSYPLLSHLDDTLRTYAQDGEDLDLNRLVPLGWGIFGWINRFATIPVFTLLSKWIHNYGIIILLLTIILKVVLFPLTYKSYMSQAKMRVLAPEIKAINDKYPDQADAMKRQQETMKLYSRAGASPFSGCLPMLLQMPILIALFSFFPSAIELRGQSFLWAHDLSAPDYVFTLPFSLPFLGNHLSLFCLLMTAVNIVYTRINMQNQPTSSSMPGMKWMMYLMPLMFLFFFNDYASGLSYYYFVSLLITIIQTYAFRWFVDEKKVRAQMLENAKKPQKKSGLMARLEAAQKRQEAMMREQNKRRK